MTSSHRVIGKSGKLVGHGGGLWRKQYLLDLEREHATGQDQEPSRREVRTQGQDPMVDLHPPQASVDMYPLPTPELRRRSVG